jgi:HAE1 family hydrophobic/amphiphilic exporter-1
MWLADTSVKRPVFATMVIMALVVLGVVSYPEIGVDLFPKVDFPIVTVSTRLMGASPEVIDVDITDKIEGAVNTINGVKSITSSSTEGNSRVTVEFILERDIDLAVQDVREKVALIRNRLPQDIDEPRIAKVDPDASAVMQLNLSGQKSVRELSTYVDEVLREQLQRINGSGPTGSPRTKSRAPYSGRTSSSPGAGSKASPRNTRSRSRGSSSTSPTSMTW